MSGTEIIKYEFKPLAKVGDGDQMKAMLRSERMHDALMQILPQFSDENDPEKHIERISAQAGLASMQNPALKECTQLSFFDSMMRVAETGLSLSRQSGEAYLVPFRDNKNGITNCTFMPGYRGLIKLSVQTGMVQSVDAVAVYDGEEFEYVEDETGAKIRHKPSLDDERVDSAIQYVYCRIHLVTGGRIVRVMNRAQVERIRASSKNKDGTPWKYYWGEMALKTVMKRGLKVIPQSVSDKASRILEHAIDLDNQAGGFIEGEIIEEELEKRREEKAADWKARTEPEPPEEPPARDPEDKSTWPKAEDGEPIPPSLWGEKP